MSDNTHIQDKERNIEFKCCKHTQVENRNIERFGKNNINTISATLS